MVTLENIKTLQELALIYTALESINEHYTNCAFLLKELNENLSYESTTKTIHSLKYLDIEADEYHIKLQRDLVQYHFSGNIGQIAYVNYPVGSEPRKIYEELYRNVKRVYANQYGPNSLTYRYGTE
jgi:hypothetical protein